MSNDSKDPNLSKSSGSSGKLSKDGTETDLWDLDFDDGETEANSKPKGVVRGSEKTKSKAPETTKPASIPEKRLTDSPILSKKPAERKIDTPVVAEATEPEVSDLKKETESAKKKPASKKVAKKSSKKTTTEKKQDESGEKPAKEVEKTPESSKDESAPTAAPGKNSEEKQKTAPSGILSSLSKAEKIGLSMLFAILALGATLTILYFSEVPTRSLISEDLDLPVEGKLVKVTAASTFWREPVTDGDEIDVVRRGTKLIPVLTMEVEAKSAAVRILFRNEDGLVIGDPINRSIKGKTNLRIPATAGFDDIGMHAAYRTGESLPWIVQVLEASESGVSIDKFTRLLETEISTDIR